MREVMQHVEKVNGVGWFIGLIVNVVWTTLTVAALYWVLHEDVALLKLRQATQLEALREVEEQMITRQEVSGLIKVAEEQHSRMWDGINRKQDRPGGLARQ